MIEAIRTVVELWKGSADPAVAKPWPFRPAPRDDELLSSWFLRVAHGLELKPFALAHMTWHSTPPLLTRDIDNMADARVVGGMAAKTGTDAERAWSTTLAAYDGYLTSHYLTGGRNAWILPVGVRHRLRKRAGLQFCPACLSETDYFRRIWRLGFVTCCPIHGYRLLDHCHACGATLEPHRSQALHVCARCEADLREAPVIPGGQRVLRLQRQALTTLQRGWGVLGKTHLAWSHLYFDALRIVAKALAVGQRSDTLRRLVARKFGGDPAPFEFDSLREIEMLDVSARYRLIDLVAAILQNWPWRLVETCQEARVWRSWLARDCDPPFLISQILDEHLTQESYSPDTAEVAAALAHLQHLHVHPSKRELRRLVGDCDAIDELCPGSLGSLRAPSSSNATTYPRSPKGPSAYDSASGPSRLRIPRAIANA